MKFYIIDCFANTKYEGNQLLVVKADRPLSDEEQQQIAREINFSETTFILSDKQANGGYDVRIWTPNVGEVPFAGHPTLGTAHVIHSCLEGGLSEKVILNLKVGQIPVMIKGDTSIMSQKAPIFGECIDKREIASIFGIADADIANEFPVQWVSTGLEAVIIPLTSRDALRAVKVNKEAFKSYVRKYPSCNCNHLFFVQEGAMQLSARCLMEDFVEDPATGSANGDLAGYLLHHNYFNSSDISYTVYQGEDMGRVSALQVHAQYTTNGEWTIEAGGTCHIVASGDWL